MTKDPDASSELELGMDDILEVAELNDFSNPSIEGAAAEPAPASIEVTPVSVEPEPEPEQEQVVAAPAPAPAPAPIAKAAQITRESPAQQPPPKTLMGLPPAKAEPAASAAPPAPNTSPIPLADLADDDRVADKTVEIRKDAVAKAAEHLADEYEGIGHTEVMVRTPELANAKSSTQRSTTQPSAVHTPSQALNVTAPVGQRPSWQPHPAAGTQPIRRQASIAPVALDAAHRSMAPSIPAVSAPAQQRGMSAGLIAGLVFGAVALIGLVGAGGFAASRALSKDNTTAASEETPLSAPGISTTTAATSTPANAAPNVAAPAAPAEESAPTTASSPAPSTAGVDVSSLPSAAPKGVTAPAHTTASSPAAAAHTTTTTASSSKTTKAVAPEKTPGPAQTTASKVDPNAPLPPPNAANANAPLPPPNAAPAAAPLAPPAAPAQHSSLGTVRVDPNLRVVQVDGAFRRAQDGAVTVSCGPHRIKAGMSERTIDVPCGGAVSF